MHRLLGIVIFFALAVGCSRSKKVDLPQGDPKAARVAICFNEKEVQVGAKLHYWLDDGGGSRSAVSVPLVKSKGQLFNGLTYLPADTTICAVISAPAKQRTAYRAAIDSAHVTSAKLCGYPVETAHCIDAECDTGYPDPGNNCRFLVVDVADSAHGVVKTSSSWQSDVL